MKALRTLFYFVLLSASAQALADIKVQQPWVAAAPPGSRVLAGYMVLQNTGDRDRTLIAVTSEQFSEVQIHRSAMQNGVMTMERSPSVVVPEHGLFELLPGGFHLMLMNPVQHFKVGDMIEFGLSFEDGAQMMIQAAVKKR